MANSACCVFVRGFRAISIRRAAAGSAAATGDAGGHEHIPEPRIMRQTRHKSSGMVRKYIREANLFRDNVSGRRCALTGSKRTDGIEAFSPSDEGLWGTSGAAGRPLGKTLPAEGFMPAFLHT